MPKTSKRFQAAPVDDQLLLEPSLIALRKAVTQQAASFEQQTVALQLPPLDTALLDQTSSMVQLRGVGASPTDGGCGVEGHILAPMRLPIIADAVLKPSLCRLPHFPCHPCTLISSCQLPLQLLLSCSAFYKHAASFGRPPLVVELPCGDHCARLLGAAIAAGSAVLGPASVAELLQAASYLQVTCSRHEHGARRRGPRLFAPSVCSLSSRQHRKWVLQGPCQSCGAARLWRPCTHVRPYR